MPRGNHQEQRFHDGDIPHDPCERAERCAGGRKDEAGDWHPAPAGQHLCLACQAVLISSLTELPGLYERLALMSANPVRTASGVHRPPASTVLVSVQADALMRDIAQVAGGWAARVREVRQLARPAAGHGTRARVTADCTVLRHAVDGSSVLLALPPAPVKRTWTWPPGGPAPDHLAELIGDLDAVHGGDGWVTAFTDLHGGDAGCELTDLRHRAARLLRETPAPPDLLDGVPCRDDACQAFGLERAPLPAGPDQGFEPAFSRCPACRDLMTRPEYDEWVKIYAAWVKGQEITCTRCEQNRHGECQKNGCACCAKGHAAA